MASPFPQPLPLNVFVSYSHRDEDLKDELVVHLANLKRQGKIRAWQDRDIEAGAEWDAEIKQQLETAEIILLLISPRFLASDYCYDLEMQRAIERHDAGEARVIPIIVKPADWQGTAFSKLQVLPKDAKPITTWDNQDEAFLNVVQGIRRAVESLQAKQSTGTAIDVDSNTETPIKPSKQPPSTQPSAFPQSSSVNSFQQERLAVQQADLQETWNLKSEQLKALRQALAIETGASNKFQLEKQVQTAETELAELTKKLEQVEQSLHSWEDTSTTSLQNYQTAGRDVINIETITGSSIRFGGS